MSVIDQRKKLVLQGLLINKNDNIINKIPEPVTETVDSSFVRGKMKYILFEDVELHSSNKTTIYFPITNLTEDFIICSQVIFVQLTESEKYIYYSYIWDLEFQQLKITLNPSGNEQIRVSAYLSVDSIYWVS